MTPDIKELVKRLKRTVFRSDWDDTIVYANPDGKDAADALEALAGEVERLTIEAKTATTLLEAEKWSRAHVRSIIVSDLETERDRLQGENFRLRSAMEARLTYHGLRGQCPCVDCSEIRSALEAKP